MAEKRKNSSLLIIGAGGHGKVAADVAEVMGCYEKIIFADDDETIGSCMGYPVFVTNSLDPDDFLQHDVFVAVGNSITRERIQQVLKGRGCFIPTLVHPSAVIARSASVARGTVVMAGAVVGPDARIGEGCILNTASSVDHDCKVGDYCHVSVGAHLAGTVAVGEHTWIGVGACINNNLTICGHCMIGSGACVVKDITDPGTYIGVPARLLREEKGSK